MNRSNNNVFLQENISKSNTLFLNVGDIPPKRANKTVRGNSKQSKRGRWALARYAKGGDRLGKVEKRWCNRNDLFQF